MEDLEYVLKNPRWTCSGQGENGNMREELSQDTKFFVVRPSRCLNHHVSFLARIDVPEIMTQLGDTVSLINDDACWMVSVNSKLCLSIEEIPSFPLSTSFRKRDIKPLLFAIFSG